MEHAQPKTTYLRDYRPADFVIDSVHLHVDLHEDETQVKSILAMQRNTLAAADAPLVLDGEDMVLKSVILDGKKLSPSQYSVNEHSLTIPHVPNKFTLETEVVIKPQENTQLSGLYKSRGNYCTQCESQGFRRITYYLDRPDVLSRFTTTITADQKKYPVLLSNGNLVESKTLSGGRHWVHWEDPFKKPSYLFALVAGDFDLLEDTFTTMSNRKIALKLFLEKGFKEQGHFALKALKKAMRWDEETFGREYDLDIYMIVAVSDFNMGAMENKGLNVFNTKYILADKATATDVDYYGVEAVIGHEYFHNWSGNRVTCRDWFQLTLKEGLTVFREQLFSDDLLPPGVARIQNANFLRNSQFPEDAGPMAHPIRPQSYIEISNFYTTTVYRKGSDVIRMIRTLLGKEKFRAAMDLYFSRHDGHAVTTDDFVKAMEDASKIDLTQFRRWYEQAGTPVLDIDGVYDEKAQTFTLTVKQSCPPTPGQPKKEPFHIPLVMGLVGTQCQDLPLQLAHEKNSTSGTRLLEIKKPVETFQFIHVKEKPIPSFLRHFSAPVMLNYPYTDEELLWLLRCDSDYFSRWEAGQTYARCLIFRLVKEVQQQRPLHMDMHLVQAFKYLLTHSQGQEEYVAMLLTLPSINYLVQFMTPMDIEALHTAYDFVKKSLASALVADFAHAYKNNLLNSYQYNATDVGRRSLKNRSLAYLVESGESQYRQWAYQQFMQSDNMTDTMGALQALINHPSEEREKALAAFYDKWREQPLVVNKWLLLQATAMLPSTLDQVKKLMQHPAFDIKNPNNAYALIRTFGDNLVCFHEKSGAGYRFMADQVLAINAFNSHVAAIIVQPLSRWQKMDKTRQKYMKEELQRIAKASKLSKDVYEIVTKSLA